MNAYQVVSIVLGMFLVSAPVYAADTQAPSTPPAVGDSDNTFEARPVASGQSQPDSQDPSGQAVAAEEPDYIAVGGKVVPNPNKSGSTPGATAAEAQTPVPAAEEPNFIVVGGKVVPNPNKQNINSPAAVAAPGGEEPNFIVVNGQVVPNPNKRGASS